MRFIAFDCDGTLVDSQQAIMHSIKLAWQSENLPVPKLSEVLSVVGLALEDSIAILNPNGSDEQQARLYKISKTGFNIGTMEESLFDDVIDTLNILNTANTTMSIITGKGRNGLDRTIEEFALTKFFPITKSADCGAGKPNPQVLLDAMVQAGANTSNAVIIGDTTFDINMGKNANIKTIGVSYGYHSVQELTDTGADIIVDSFAQLPQAIDKLLKA